MIKGIVHYYVAQDFHIYDSFSIKNMINVSYNYDHEVNFYRD